MERKRQDILHPNNDINDYFAILAEEILEVAKAIHGEGNLQEELIQVAAVCVRWVESL